MTIQLTYPGVYVQQLPSGSHTITGVSTSVTAIIGYLRRGPIDTPVPCVNFGEFQRVFGGLDAESPVSFQVWQFFINGGTEIWVSRTCDSASPPVVATAALVGSAQPTTSSGAPTQSTGQTLVEITAQNPGSWAENILLTVDYLTNQPGQFNLTATLYAHTGGAYTAVQTQRVPAVTLDPTQPNSIVEVIKAGDPIESLLAVPDLAKAPPVLVPFASGTVLKFTTPSAPVRATFTITLQPPADGTASPPPTLEWTLNTPFSIATVADLVTAIEQAFFNTSIALGHAGLGGVQVRSCLSPFGSPGSQAQLVQISVPDPAYAGNLIGISSDQSGLFSVESINVQAQPLGPPTGVADRDGLPPTGFDIAGNEAKGTGIFAFDAVPLVNIITVPDMAAMDSGDYLTAVTATLNYATKREAFAILDMPQTITTPAEAQDWATKAPGNFGSGLINAATYWPQVQVPSPFSSQLQSIGTSGTMAGQYAATDANRGVWKAPAGISASLAGVQQLSYVLNDHENGVLNPLGINALRTFPVYGNVAWGARTLAAANPADNDWMYIPVRRLALYLEQSLQQGLQWVVFEPNDPQLWAQIRLSVNSFLHPLFLQGAFVGVTADQAYTVICDESTTTPADVDNGVVNVLVMFAPVKPAEFIVINLQLAAGQSAT